VGPQASAHDPRSDLVQNPIVRADYFALVEENVAGRSHVKKFALQFEFHDASSRARDAMSS
jgi:hypothetical protein